MSNALVFDMPVESGLELMPIVCPYLSDAEGKASDDVVDEGDGVGLVVPVVDLEGPDAGGIVNGSVLVTFDRLPVFSLKDQELDVNLDLVAGNLSLVASGVDLAEPCPPRESVQAIPLENARDASSGDLDVVVACQIPDDAHGPQVVGLAQVKNLLDDLRRRSVPGVLRDRLLPNLSSLTMPLERGLPAVEAGSADAEVAAGPGDVSSLLSVLQDPKFALNITVCQGHRDHPPGPIGL